MDIDVRDVGPAPLLAALGRQLGIIQAINETVQWDAKQCFVDPGTHTLAMIIDILLGRSPLYLVEKHYAEMDAKYRGQVLKYHFFEHAPNSKRELILHDLTLICR
ncbi:MAG: DUF4277 domain-containing protein [Bacillota bacterium]|nr:DUF4277 domain-containing protein [Bacillota bacterium]